jgi:hypothetical protein
MKFWVIFVCLGFVRAQAPATQAKSVVGEVVSLDAAEHQIKLKADVGGTYTVNLDEKTSYLRVPPGEKDLKKATKIALSDVTSGDRMLALGPVSEETKSVPARAVIIMTKTDLAQKHERDRAEWQKRGMGGVVTTVNADTHEITVTTRGRDARTLVVDASAKPAVRQYAADSVKFSDAKPGNLSDIKAGDNIRVLGDKSEDGSRVKAEEIVFGSFQTIAATVVSVEASSATLHLTDLQTKKPLTVKTTPDTVLRRLPPQMAQMMAARMRGEVPAGGPAGGPNAPPRPPEGAQQAPPGGGQRGNGDISQVLERMPPLMLEDLRPGDALIVSSSKGADPSTITAITLVAGVEPFLAAAPKTAGVVNLGAWNLDVGGIPEP